MFIKKVQYTKRWVDKIQALAVMAQKERSVCMHAYLSISKALAVVALVLGQGEMDILQKGRETDNHLFQGFSTDLDHPDLVHTCGPPLLCQVGPS